VYVVDSCYVKQAAYNPLLGLEGLLVAPTSKVGWEGGGGLGGLVGEAGGTGLVTEHGILAWGCFQHHTHHGQMHLVCCHVWEGAVCAVSSHTCGREGVASPWAVLDGGSNQKTHSAWADQ
jgi:hypothetical protein